MFFLESTGRVKKAQAESFEWYKFNFYHSQSENQFSLSDFKTLFLSRYSL